MEAGEKYHNDGCGLDYMYERDEGVGDTPLNLAVDACIYQQS